MFFAIFKFFKLLAYLFVVLGPAHYYLLYITKDPSLAVRGVNFVAYAAMWAIALGEIDFHCHRFDGQVGAVVPALRWWVRDTIAATFLGIAIAILLHNLVHGTKPLATQSPLLPGFFDALSCANHSCHIVGEGGPNGYHTVSVTLVNVAEHAQEADQALNGLLLKIPLAVETLDAEVSERRHYPASALDISQAVTSMFDFLQLEQSSPLHRSLLHGLALGVDYVERLVRRADFLAGGGAAAGNLSPSMLVALGGWNSLIVEARLSVVSLDRVLDKLGDDFDLILLVQRSIIHAEKSVHLSRMLSTPKKSAGKLDATKRCLQALEPVEAFRDRARNHGSSLRSELNGLLKIMERIPRRATSKVLMCTEDEMSELRMKVQKVRQGIVVEV